MNCPQERSLLRQLHRAPSPPECAALYVGENGYWECLARLASGRVVCYRHMGGQRWKVNTR